MKTSKILITFLILISFLSCNKEELYIPSDDSDQKSLESTEFSSRFNQYGIKLERKKAPFKNLRENSAVEFNGMLWIVTNDALVSQVWSSSDGKSWYLRRTNQFPTRVGSNLSVYKNKMWIIGGREVWSSRNGLKWSRVTKNTPFGHLDRSGAVVFNERMFVFEYKEGEGQIVYSSENGYDWDLENGNAFPRRISGKCIVFNNKLYYIGGSNPFVSYNTIWQSSNGRDWVKQKIHSLPMFSGRDGHSAVEYKGKVWLIGGRGHYSNDVMNDIWYSSNMYDWQEYNGTGELPPLHGHNTVAFNNKIFILGGILPSTNVAGVRISRAIWSIGIRNSVNF